MVMDMPQNSFTESGLVCSENYSETMDGFVLPYLKEKEQVTLLPVGGGVSVYCTLIPAGHPRGTVVIVHGFTENAYKYAEIIYSLHANGYTVLAYDHRGHGRSTRAEGLQGLSVTHVDRFDDYVSDMKAVTGHFLPGLPKPWLVFCHSMGGAVTALFLERYPEVFSAAFMCAPMIAPNTGVPKNVARAMAAAAVSGRKGRDYPFFMKPYSGPEDFDTSCATDRNRFDWYDRIKAATPEFQNSIPSYNWILESLRVTRRILAKGAPERISCPVLLSTADKDYSVMPKPQEKFIARVPKGRRIFVPGSRHEIFRSQNDVLFPWWDRVLAYFSDPESILKEESV